LPRIGKWAFHETGLIEIAIPALVEGFGQRCFFEYESLFAVTVASESKLSRIKKEAFTRTGLVEIIIPASVQVSG
jgi:hypothetical protein